MPSAGDIGVARDVIIHHAYIRLLISVKRNSTTRISHQAARRLDDLYYAPEERSRYAADPHPVIAYQPGVPLAFFIINTLHADAAGLSDASLSSGSLS